MAKRLTFVDAGVLIAAARGKEDSPENRRAREILDDPDRAFASSDFVRLETAPWAVHHGNRPEAQFYEEFFAAVSAWAVTDSALVTAACGEVEAIGLAALDAIHVAASKALGADEIITTEKAAKPIHRVTGLKVVTIHAGGDA